MEETKAKKPTVAELTAILGEVAGTVKALGEKVDALSAAQSAPKVTTTVAKNEYSSQTIEQSFPVPMEYRSIVDTVLNSRFGIEVTPMPDKPAFMFTIVVPNEYSNAGAAYLETYKVDRRPRVIDYASGTNGVREWTELVFKNLDQDTRTRVALDRANA